jgi:pimeloyl-ACP methyl ester carboxylesterase
MAYGPLASLLSDRYAAIMYDRRCNARSTGDVTADLDMAQQARDALAVLRASGHQSATIFGNSGGASIALQLAADAPMRVKRLVLHEPPAVSLLDDGGKTLTFVKNVHAAFESGGAPAAIRLFASGFVDFDFGRGPPGGPGQQKDLEFFFAHEYWNIMLAEPNLSAIREAGVSAVVLAGEKGGAAYYVQAALKVAEGLGSTLTIVPGNHLAFLIEPARFAGVLKRILSSAT